MGTFAEEALEYAVNEGWFDHVSKRLYLLLTIVGVASLAVIAWKL